MGVVLKESVNAARRTSACSLEGVGGCGLEGISCYNLEKIVHGCGLPVILSTVLGISEWVWRPLVDVVQSISGCSLKGISKSGSEGIRGCGVKNIGGVVWQISGCSLQGICGCGLEDIGGSGLVNQWVWPGGHRWVWSGGHQ